VDYLLITVMLLLLIGSASLIGIGYSRESLALVLLGIAFLVPTGCFIYFYGEHRHRVYEDELAELEKRCSSASYSVYDGDGDYLGCVVNTNFDNRTITLKWDPWED
jgi:hypothetical protein